MRDWEPREALIDEGQTEAARTGALDTLRPGALLVLEAHAEHAKETGEMLEALGYER